MALSSKIDYKLGNRIRPKPPANPESGESDTIRSGFVSKSQDTSCPRACRDFRTRVRFPGLAKLSAGMKRACLLIKIVIWQVICAVGARSKAFWQLHDQF